MGTSSFRCSWYWHSFRPKNFFLFMVEKKTKTADHSRQLCMFDAHPTTFFSRILLWSFRPYIDRNFGPRKNSKSTLGTVDFFVVLLAQFRQSNFFHSFIQIFYISQLLLSPRNLSRRPRTLHSLQSRVKKQRSLEEKKEKYMQTMTVKEKEFLTFPHLSLPLASVSKERKKEKNWI